MKDVKRLETQSIPRLLASFAIPGMVGLFVMSMYNVCDRIIVGRKIGEIGLSAITMVYPINIIRFGLCAMVAIGASTLISISLGEKDKKEAEKILGCALFFGIMISLCLSFLGVVFPEPILRFFGTKGKILPHSIEYMKMIYIGAIFMFGSFFFNFTIRADGNPKYSMFLLITSSILNIILDYIFVFPLNMGVKGAALATVIAQFFPFVLGGTYYFMGKGEIGIKLKNIKFDFPITKQIITVGSPVLFRDGTWSAQNWFLNYQLIKYGGATAVGAMGIVFAVLIFSIMPIVGVLEGMQPIISYNLGAKKYKRVKETVIFACKSTTVIAILVQIFLFVFPQEISSLFTKDENLIKTTSIGIRLFFAGMLFAGVTMVLDSYFYSVKKVKKAIISQFLRKAVIFFLFLYTLPLFLGTKGIWLSMAGSNCMFAVISSFWLFYELKQIDKKINQDEKSAPIL